MRDAPARRGGGDVAGDDTSADGGREPAERGRGDSHDRSRDGPARRDDPPEAGRRPEPHGRRLPDREPHTLTGANRDAETPWVKVAPRGARQALVKKLEEQMAGGPGGPKITVERADGPPTGPGWRRKKPPLSTPSPQADAQNTIGR